MELITPDGIQPSDPYIESFFDLDDFSGKVRCKRKIQEQFGLLN